MNPPAEFVRFEPERWLVCFDRKSNYAWLNRLIPGRFKHVRAFGFVEVFGLWVFVDHCGPRLIVEAVPDIEVAHARMNVWMADCVVLIVPRGFGTRMRFRPLANCVSTISHLIGLPYSALLPDGLYRNCIRYGGRVLEAQDEHAPP